jgi:hypothetical protein
MGKLLASLVLLLAMAAPSWAAITTVSYDDTTTPVMDNADFFMVCHHHETSTGAANLADFEAIDGSEITATFTKLAVDYIWIVVTEPNIVVKFEYDHATDDVLWLAGDDDSSAGWTVGQPIVLDLRHTNGLTDLTDDTPADNVLVTTEGFAANEVIFYCIRARLVP